MSTSHVLNLVRHRASTLSMAANPSDLSENQVVALVDSAAVLICRAALASPEILGRIADRAHRCQSAAILNQHCGECPEQSADFCGVMGSLCAGR